MKIEDHSCGKKNIVLVTEGGKTLQMFLKRKTAKLWELHGMINKRSVPHSEVNTMIQECVDYGAEDVRASQSSKA